MKRVVGIAAALFVALAVANCKPKPLTDEVGQKVTQAWVKGGFNKETCEVNLDPAALDQLLAAEQPKVDKKQWEEWVAKQDKKSAPETVAKKKTKKCMKKKNAKEGKKKKKA